MHASHSSALLPDLFRHKTTKIRVYHPKAILVDFHGTISERRWEDKVIFPYVKQNVVQYLKTNWYNDAVQQCYYGLRNESFEQRFRNKYEDAPVISDTAGGLELEPDQIIRQVSDFLIWQMDNKKETKDTQVMEKLIWLDGLKKQQIKVPLFDDVMPCIQTWHDVNKCKIFIISSLEEELLKLLFENTDKGNLGKYIDGYYPTKKAGEKIMDEIYQRIFEDWKKICPQVGQYKESASRKSKLVKSVSSVSSSEDRHKQACLDAMHPKPILFLTDCGQEAKAASKVAGGQAFECVLVNRPGNRRIRTYYLSNFPYIESFTDIQFV